MAGIRSRLTPGIARLLKCAKFANARSYLWWMFREALDPRNNRGVALPPDKQLEIELCMPRCELRVDRVYVEGRDDLLDPRRLRKSPDIASAYVFALIDTPKEIPQTAIENEGRRQRGRSYDPFELALYGRR
jgi:hypothetical protein